MLISEKLCFPLITSGRCVFPCQFANIVARRDADRLFSDGIYKRCGGLAVIFYAQGAPANVTTSGSGDAVHEAAIRFGDRKQAFLVLRQGHLEQAARQQSDANAENLSRTDLMVMCRAGSKQFVKVRYGQSRRGIQSSPIFFRHP